MRNKKITLIVTLIIAVTVITCSFAGCQKKATSSEVLASLYNAVDNTYNQKIVELTNLDGYSNVRFYGGGIATAQKTENDSTTYVLFNAVENKIIKTSDAEFHYAINGVFYIEHPNNEDDVEFYDITGNNILGAVNNASFQITNNAIVFFNGAKIISTKSGVKLISPDLSINFADYEERAVKTGNVKIYFSDDEDNFLVFDLDGEFLYQNKISSLVNYKTESLFNMGSGRLLLQTELKLTEIEAKEGYSYINESGDYISLQTYIYNFESKALTKLDIDKVILGTQPASDKDDAYVMVAALDITSDKRLSNNRNLFVTDSILNVRANLNDYVDNAQSFLSIDENTFVIGDGLMNYVYNKNGKRIKSYRAEGLSVNYRNGLLERRNIENEVVEFYDYQGDTRVNLSRNQTLVNTSAITKGLVFFEPDRSSQPSLYIYSAETDTTTTLDGKFKPMSGNLFGIEDAEGNLKIYSSYDASLISDKTFRNAYVTTAGEYSYVVATDIEGNVVRLLYSLESASK